jgi:hypothetical protein
MGKAFGDSSSQLSAIPERWASTSLAVAFHPPRITVIFLENYSNDARLRDYP